MRGPRVTVRVDRVQSTRLTVVNLYVPFDVTPEEVDEAFERARDQVRLGG